MNGIFRGGTFPSEPLEGRFGGELIALDLVPVFTPLFKWWASLWMPWLGKTFNAANQSGDNVFTKDSLYLARLFNPLYRGFRADGPNTYKAFNFRTYAAQGLYDTDRTVLKIDYNLPDNPVLTVRRVVDELVYLDRGLYLGKAHLQWWFGNWQTVAFFTLFGEGT